MRLREQRKVSRAQGEVFAYTADLHFHNWLRYVDPVLSLLLKGVGRRALDGLVSAWDG